MFIFSFGKVHRHIKLKFLDNSIRAKIHNFLSEAKFYKTMKTRYLFNLTNNDSFRESSVSIRISEF